MSLGNLEDLILLTRREEEIMKFVVMGLADKEIADRLCISVRTVNTHMTRIYDKICAKNRAEAVRIYLKTVMYPDLA